MADDKQCSCWRCWVQSNFTPIVLLLIVFVSFVATVVLMHEDSIDDKYVTWLEGFCMGAMTSLAVALRASTPVSHDTRGIFDPTDETGKPKKEPSE